MKIRLPNGISNMQRQGRNVSYYLFAHPRIYYPSLGEHVLERSRRGFFNSAVTFVIAERSSSRINKEFQLSEEFESEAEYSKALDEGFAVPATNTAAARFLIRLGLAEGSA